MNLVDTNSEKELAGIVERIIAGDSEAEDEVIQRFLQGLAAIIYRIVRSDSATEDVLQETFRIVLEKLRLGELRQPERVRGFVLLVARNAAFDHIRKARSRGYSAEVFYSEEAQSLVSTRIDDLEAELDSLMARLQTPNARKALNSAFHASPAQLGRAAVKAARKRS